MRTANFSLSLIVVFSLGSAGCARKSLDKRSGSDPRSVNATTHTFTGSLKQTLSGHTEEVWAVAFSPDGKTLASGGDDTSVKLWDVQTGKEKQTLSGHKYKVATLAFSPDGKSLASGSEDYTVKIWDLATGALKQTLNHDYQITAIAFSPDGNTLACAVYSGNIVLWDAQTWTQKRTIEGKDVVRGAAFSPDSKLLASATEKAIKLWNAQSGILEQTLTGHTSDVRGSPFLLMARRWPAPATIAA